jgi:hypothetical protein
MRVGIRYRWSIGGAQRRVLGYRSITYEHVDAVLPVLPAVPTVVLSSVDVYQAFVGFRTGRCESPVPLTEDSELRRERYPYRGAGLPGVPDAYENSMSRSGGWAEAP